jgi:ATP-binding cassette subfamily B protein
MIEKIKSNVLAHDAKKNALDYIKALKLVFVSNPLQCSFLLIGILIQGTLSSATIWLSSKVITEISKLQHYDRSVMIYLCIAWCLSLLVSNFIEPWILYWQSNVSDNAVHNINKNIIEKSNSIKRLDFFEKEEFYNDIQVLQSQASNKPINLVVTTVGLARDIVIITTLLLLLYSIVPWVSLVVLISAYINYKTFSVLQEKTWQESLGRSVDSRKMNYLSMTSINARFAKEIRLFNLGSYLVDEYVKGFKNIHTRMKKVRLKQALWPILPILLTAAGNLLAFVVIVNSAMTGATRVGAVILFLQALSQLHLTVTNFGEQAGWLKGHILFFSKYFNFIKLKEVTNSDHGSISLGKLENVTIEFKNVSFAILKNINFTINKGEKIAIIGENGGGKSTLIKLLCGFYTPTSGEILINGKSLNSINLDHWRDQISPLFQDYNSYSFPLHRNIIMGKTLVQDDLNNASLNSGVSNFASLLPNEMNALLGKDFGGAELSIGEWQKVALARALYKNAPLYFMDEPTSSMDPLSERTIFTKFIAGAKDKTVIFVTHKLSLSLLADKIILFHQGEVVGQGDHKDLLVTSKLYAEMFKSQADIYLNSDLDKEMFEPIINIS